MTEALKIAERLETRAVRAEEFVAYVDLPENREGWFATMPGSELQSHRDGAADLRNAAAALRSLHAENERRAWRTMESAPKDGSEFLAWPCETADGPIIAKATWYDHPSVCGWVTDEIDCNDYDFSPTHWQPLPEPPAREALANQQKD